MGHLYLANWKTTFHVYLMKVGRVEQTYLLPYLSSYMSQRKTTSVMSNRPTELISQVALTGRIISLYITNSVDFYSVIWLAYAMKNAIKSYSQQSSIDFSLLRQRALIYDLAIFLSSISWCLQKCISIIHWTLTTDIRKQCWNFNAVFGYSKGQS